MSDYITIPLTKGQETIIDVCDSDLALHKWFALETDTLYYAARNTPNGNRQKIVKLHRVIYSRIIGRELTKEEKIDHRNGNSLDNRRENLRFATSSQNTQNSKRYSTNTSGYKGVTWCKRTKKWATKITVDKKRKHLGYFENLLDAYEAYKESAIKHYKEFARLE